MTRRLHDPLELLRRLPTPEPDAARMQATIAAARARLVDGGPSRSVFASRRPRWWRWVAAGATTLAAVATVAVLMPRPDAPQLAGKSPTPAGEVRDLAREAAAPPARLPAAPTAPGLEPAEPPARVMGARPPQALPQTDAELLPKARRHDFGGFQIVARDTADGITLLFLQGGTETQFDRHRLDPGVGFELLDAFLLTLAEAPELLLLQSRIGDATNWDVFILGPDGIRRSGELSQRVHDARDRAAAVQRLGALE